MTGASPWLLAVLLAGAPAGTRGFRGEVGRFLKAEATWGVLVRADLPTTVVEIVDGDWRIAAEAPVHEGRLARGVVVEIEALRFDGLWIELQVAAAEGEGSALLRFRLPFQDGAQLEARDAPAARRYLERFVRLFASRKAADEFAAELAAAASSK